jgi:ATP-dependent exoDNAse (exonuclease V) beta subunit
MIIQQVAKFFEIYRTSKPGAWEPVAIPNLDFTRRLQELLIAFPDLKTSNGHLRRFLQIDLARVANGDLEGLSSSTLARRFREGETTYHSKEVESQNLVFYQGINSILSDYITAEYARRTSSAYYLIDGFSKELWPLQVEAAQLRFSDVPFLLEPLFSDLQPDFELRLDQEICHLLLDEFQDTSPTQWSVLNPIAQKILNKPDPGTFFCVGDKKQAIYSWRGGVAEIFDVVENQLREHLSPADPLATSYRSSPVIMEAVNMVFENLDRCLKSEGKEVDRSVLLEWQRNFPHHTTAKTELPGYVRIAEASVDGPGDHINETLAASEESSDNNSGESESPSNKAIMHAATVAAIRDVYNSSPQATIGVLVSNHSDISRILFGLHQADIPASGEGGNSLDDSAAVNILLSLLQLIDHPHDAIARYHVSHTRLGSDLGLEPETILNQAANTNRAFVVASELRRELIRDGYGKTLERMAKSLIPDCTSRERRRLEQLIEFAYTYSENWTLRTSHFLKDILKTRILEPSAARVRVMTIHAAKGLEFDVVIAPIVSVRGRWRGSTPDLIYARSNPADKIDLVFRYARSEHQVFFPQKIRDAFSEYQRQEIREQICLLYVVMTRAIHALHVILPPATKSGQPGLASVLLDAISPTSLSEGETVLLELGDRQWHEHVFSSKLDRKSIVSGEPYQVFYQSPTPFELRPSNLDPILASAKSSIRTRPSKVAQPEPAAPLGSQWVLRKASLDLGDAIHLCLEQIEWWDERPTTGKIKSHLQQAGISTTLIRETLNFFESLPERSGLMSILDRQKYYDWIFHNRYDSRIPLMEPLQVRIKTEQRITAYVSGQQISGVIDRLALLYRGDELFGAEIIDFKTDEVDERTLSRKLQEHRPQLLAYRDATIASLQLPIEKVWTRVAFVKLDRVSDLETKSKSQP